MTTLTPSELRALDLFMAEKVMGWKRVERLSHLDFEGTCFILKGGIVQRYGSPYLLNFYPTESPADAMMVLKKVAEGDAPGEYLESIIIDYPGHYVLIDYDKPSRRAEAPTLELAICLFAREVTCG